MQVEVEILLNVYQDSYTNEASNISNLKDDKNEFNTFPFASADIFF